MTRTRSARPRTPYARLTSGLAAKLDAHPQEDLTGNSFRNTTRVALISDDNFPELAQMWQQVDKNGTVKRTALADQPDDSSTAVLLSIICGDTSWTKDLATYQADSVRDAKRYPISGAMASNVWPCAFWPVAPKEPLVKITADGPSNILVMQNLRDPATYYPGGVQMRAALGNRARLVSVDQGGHGVYLLSQNACAADIATQFLVSGAFPAQDRFCTGTTGSPNGDRGSAIKRIEASDRLF